jgi:phage tail-like protein
MMEPFYPRIAFYFKLSFSGIEGSKDAAFQEATGIHAETEMEEVMGEGENRFKYKLPGKTKHGSLVLKRGFIAIGSPLAKWCTDVLGGSLNTPITPQTITVELLDPEGNTVEGWDFVNAYPVKWGVSGFRSKENQYVVESIEFAYNYFKKSV